MKHRSKKLLGGPNQQYFNEQRLVNLLTASREISERRCLRTQVGGHLEV
jgi:hypothetical protein